ncbi:MAG TPA: hypothetical protein VKP58_01545 [Candidatus Acidoferrum sp.]|nr:hypothetical protein [Candidatus Acidoferrum sp.]
MAEDVCDLGFAEARGVVFERDLEPGFIDLEATEAIGVGEFAERAELIGRERGLEFEFGFKECHGGIIAKRGWREDGGGSRAGDSALAVEIEERSLHYAAPRAKVRREEKAGPLRSG